MLKGVLGHCMSWYLTSEAVLKGKNGRVESAPASFLKGVVVGGPAR
jgi:hypothetical protein